MTAEEARAAALDYGEEYAGLRRWLTRQLDEADADFAKTGGARHTSDNAARIRKAAIIEYNRRLDALKAKYAGSRAQ